MGRTRFSTQIWESPRMSLLWIRCSRNCLELMNRFFECLDPVSWGQFFQVIHVACEGALVRGGGGGHIIPGSATKARKVLCIVIISWLHSLSTYMSNKVRNPNLKCWQCLTCRYPSTLPASSLWDWLPVQVSDSKEMEMASSHALEKVMAPHSSTLAWKIPWTEEPGRLQSMR